MTEIKKKDYVVAEIEGKRCLVRTTHVDEDELTGIWEHGEEETKVTVLLASVKAVLGPHPHIGSVFGCKTERLVEVEELQPFHCLEWFFECPQGDQDVIKEGIMKGARRLREMKLSGILKACKLRVVLNTARSLTAKSVIGTYRLRAGSSDSPDVITVKHHVDSIDMLPYLLAHEAGHGIWSRLMSAETRSKWVSAFLSKTKCEWVDEDTVADAITNAVRNRTLSLENEDEQAALDAVLAYIKSEFNLRSQDVLLLLHFDLSKAKTLLSGWRRYRYPVGEIDLSLTEYSSTNPEEFFCEALACVSVKKVLPEYLKELWQETLEEVQSRSYHAEE